MVKWCPQSPLQSRIGGGEETCSIHNAFLGARQQNIELATSVPPLLTTKEKYSPTADFLLLENKIDPAMNTILRAQTMMFAMFPKFPPLPTLRITQFGLTPTGADFGSADAPTNSAAFGGRSGKWEI